MDFYQAISKHYREIFPLNPMQKGFVNESFTGTRKKNLQDAGFSSISYYGNFRRDPLEKDSIPMVVEACL